jgi:hypothetical protein
MQGKQLLKSLASVLPVRALPAGALSVLFLSVLLLLSASVARAELLPVKIYNTEDGLAHDRIRRIVKDSRGFLWICTAEGLSRFDGYGFVTYNKRHGLPGNDVLDLLETRQGAYWIATDSGVCRLNSSAYHKVDPGAHTSTAASQTANLFTVYTLSNATLSNRVTSLCEDRSG